MKLASLLALPPAILSSLTSAVLFDYREHLDLKPLAGGALYAGFSFNSRSSLASYSNDHFRYFPRSLAQILQYTHTAELHLRFALGRWDEESWGSRPRHGRREGGNGVELWAWVEDGGEDLGIDSRGGAQGAEERWADLVNSLSGLFCASLNFVDSGKTINPVLSFAPEGSLDLFQQVQTNTTGKRQGELRLLHGMLPHEVVCTENLTPFLKLLPCKGKAGISSLLDGHKLFDANWQTMAVDVRPVCSTTGDCELEIEQTVDMVLDIERSMRPRESPIPRPPPIDDILCDEEKDYNAHDSCYPKPLEGEMEWSLSRIFGRAIRGSCPLAGTEGDLSDVSLELTPGRTVETVDGGAIRQSTAAYGQLVSYTLPEGKDFDLFLPPQKLDGDQQQNSPLDEPPVYASRQMTGYGAERGGMHTLLRNPHPYAQRVVYLESLPWFLRPYIHTLKLSGEGRLEEMYYTPLLDRERGTHLELLLEIPPESTVEITYDFEKAILRYTEYPPDANRGFDVPAAIIRVLPWEPEGLNPSFFRPEQYLRTTSLLLPLPTPDFSMPYNVIILTSTVIALGFGSIFNLLVRRFVLVEEVPVSPLSVLVGKLKERIVQLRAKKIKGGGGVQEKLIADGKISNGKPKEGAVDEKIRKKKG
jgi:phosphatidylinositol glycan class T